MGPGSIGVWSPERRAAIIESTHVRSCATDSGSWRESASTGPPSRAARVGGHQLDVDTHV